MPQTSTLSLILFPISSLKRRFKDILFYCFDHVPLKESVQYASTNVAIFRWWSWGRNGTSHTEFQSGRAEIVFLTSLFCFDVVSGLHRRSKESLCTPDPMAPNVNAPSHSLYFLSPTIFFLTIWDSVADLMPPWPLNTFVFISPKQGQSLCSLLISGSWYGHRYNIIS